MIQAFRQMPDRNRYLIVLMALLLPIVAALGYSMRYHRIDDGYITYRYAQNLIRGHGFVFNPGENVLGTTAPLHGLLLAVLSLAFSDLPTLANVVSAIAAFVMAVFMFLILAEADLPRAGVFSGLLIVVNVWTYLFAPLETILSAAMAWAIIYFAWRNRWWAMSVIGACAIVTRADAVLLLMCVSAAYWLRSRDLRRIIKSALTTGILVSPWFIYAYITYGAPLSNTAATKTGWEGHWLTFLGNLWPKILTTLVLDSTGLSVLVLVLAGIGLIRILVNKACRPLAVVPAWMLVYTLAYTVMRISDAFGWYYYPLIVGFIFLSGVGLDGLFALVEKQWTTKPRARSTLRTAITLVVTLFVGVQILHVISWSNILLTHRLSGARDDIYKVVSTWLSEHTRPTDAVAMIEVGTIAYYSDRHMIDLLGLVTPGVAEHLKQGDYNWAVEAYDPDYVLFNDRPKHESDTAPWIGKNLFSVVFERYHWVRTFEIDSYPYMLDVYKRSD